MNSIPEHELRLEKLRRLRTGKKSAITKRIARLLDMVQAGGCSRRQIRSLTEKLVGVFEDLEKVCTEISEVSVLHGLAEDELNSLEEVRMNVDECVVQIEDHLESRQGELASSSSDSYTKSCSWLSEHSEIMGSASARCAEEVESVSKEVEGIIKAYSNLSLLPVGGVVATVTTLGADLTQNLGAPGAETMGPPGPQKTSQSFSQIFDGEIGELTVAISDDHSKNGTGSGLVTAKESKGRDDTSKFGNGTSLPEHAGTGISGSFEDFQIK